MILTRADRGPVADLLRKAHTELTVHGWHQGDLVGDHGQMCLIAALHRAAGGSIWDEPTDPTALRTLRLAETALSIPFGPVRGDEAGVLIAWNDQADRTAAQVLALLSQTAATLDPTASVAQ